MVEGGSSRLAHVLATRDRELLGKWIDEQKATGAFRTGLVDEAELREESESVLQLLREAAASAPSGDLGSPEWKEIRQQLAQISQARARRGVTPTDTALFVLSLKKPLFDALRAESDSNADLLAAELWEATTLLDRLSLYTMEIFQKGREEVIVRQQREMLELSTPVIKLWEGILALPLIGTLDSERTQVVMETLLQSIVDTGSTLAIIDITGVLTVDTRVAQHLLQTVAAARMMGADCIVSGIRPQIAQTIVHLGLLLPDVVTKASLADAFRLALQRKGLTVHSTVSGA
jgi:rsbT co-antagonist protein RsbR